MTDYTLLGRQLDALLDTPDWLTNSAQTCALLMQEIPALNWAGFYLQRQPNMLHLGPFQASRPATPFPSTRRMRRGSPDPPDPAHRRRPRHRRPHRLRQRLPGRAGRACRRR